MKITTENHFDLVFRFFEVMAVHIIKALREKNIEKEEQFKELLEEFLFSVAVDLDQYYIKDTKIGDKKFYPMICFRDTEDVQETQEMVVPDGNDAFHETMPFGVVEEVFGMREKKLGFTYGNECSQVDL